mmetsp:Transcript_72670/g.170951  ORF Transcript_72670/g.170951 Transcript_72670/m.170951 type:complete len:113 (+) Transcript_72670:1-339(+)
MRLCHRVLKQRGERAMLSALKHDTLGLEDSENIDSSTPDVTPHPGAPLVSSINDGAPLGSNRKVRVLRALGVLVVHGTEAPIADNKTADAQRKLLISQLDQERARHQAMAAV